MAEHYAGADGPRRVFPIRLAPSELELVTRAAGRASPFSPVHVSVGAWIRSAVLEHARQVLATTAPATAAAASSSSSRPSSSSAPPSLGPARRPKVLS